MPSLKPWSLLPISALMCACGTPHLVPVNGTDDDTAVVRKAGITLVAARNLWCEDQLEDVSTPIGITVVNDSDDTVPVGLGEFSLVDERGQAYPAIPPERVVHELFGDNVAIPPPGSEPPLRAPPPPGMPGRAPGEEGPQQPEGPDAPEAPPAVEAPQPMSRQDTEAQALDVTLVSHGVGAVGGGGHASIRAAPARRYGGGPGRYGYGAYGRYGYGHYGYGFGYGYGWYAGAWPYGWWFGPAYVVGPDNPYAAYYDPRSLEYFGPEQVLTVALRDDDLAPHERMGGLVYFAPAWDARLLTLRFMARPEDGKPMQLATRFEVSR